MSDRIKKTSSQIPKGYILKARCIEDSAIAHAPPHARELFDYFLRKAFWKDGDKLKRGQLLTNYKQIQDDLRWYVGNRPMRYERHQIETAMKLLARTGAVTRARTTRGLIVTVCNYGLYQSPENYENHSETVLKPTRKPRENHTIDEEGIKHKKKKNSPYSPPEGDDSDKASENQSGIDYPQDFSKFWAVFPNKTGKGAAFKAWQKIKGRPSVDELVASLKQHAMCDKWIRDEGRYIPNPTKWLNQRRWEDEVKSHVKVGASQPAKKNIAPDNPFNLSPEELRAVEERRQSLARESGLKPERKSYPDCPAGLVPYEYGGDYFRPGNEVDERLFKKKMGLD